MTDFCKGCGIKLPNQNGLVGITNSILGTGGKVYEFEDGKYCEKCAKAKVDNKRKKL